MSDYPARSRGFLLAYAAVFICLGSSIVAAVLAYGRRIEELPADEQPAPTDQHWSGQP